MTTVTYPLSLCFKELSNPYLQNLPADFTLNFQNDKYQTSKILVSMISPKISRLLLADSSLSSFSVRYKCSSDHISALASLLKGESVILTPYIMPFFNILGQELENNNIISLLRDHYLQGNISKKNCTARIFFKKQNNESYTYEIEYAVTHFQQLQNLDLLSPNDLMAIFTHTSFKNIPDDYIFNEIVKLGETYYSCLNCIHPNKLSKSNLESFINISSDPQNFQYTFKPIQKALIEAHNSFICHKLTDEEKEKALKELSPQVCTYSVTKGDSFIKQQWFHCKTCQLEGELGMCAACAINCHKGHEIYSKNEEAAYCDCGASGKCKCLDHSSEPVNPIDNPIAPQVPNPFEPQPINPFDQLNIPQPVDPQPVNIRPIRRVCITKKKPAIYLYPKEITNVTVNIRMNALTTIYPQMSGDGDEFRQNHQYIWKVVAHPDGDLIINSKRYFYLFWEGASDDDDYDLSKGFIVEGKNVAAFLEEKLEKMGLNVREKQDFIVFWLPFMEKNKYNLITFQTERYTEKAILTITPKPQHLIRIFMVFKAIPEPIEIPEPEIEEIKRDELDGFVAIEWGGSELESNVVH